MLGNIIDEILHTTLRTRDTTDEIVSRVSKSNPSRCEIVSCGSTRWRTELVTSLEVRAKVGVTIAANRQQESTLGLQSAPRTSKKEKLAIVGMAGRFPDAADHEKFWELLEAGLDVHRKVSILFMIGSFMTFSIFTEAKPSRRYPKIASMWKRTLTLQGRFATQATLLSDASSKSLVFLIHDFSICHRARPLRQTRCIALAWQVLTRPWKWRDTFPIGLLLRCWTALGLSMARPVMTGERSMQPKMSTLTSSLVACEHLRP